MDPILFRIIFQKRKICCSFCSALSGAISPPPRAVFEFSFSTCFSSSGIFLLHAVHSINLRENKAVNFRQVAMLIASSVYYCLSAGVIGYCLDESSCK
ncbi:hypothetical protein T07_7047 [Trichinella nelsoni]|uniref:Uncharacterized protein n=1 Tax=Trichinella nelsoni TaxID=6336 RepID=A0A0V0RL63_9BILA|nr:hypothetical protein T07_7047 [Trichinella nelsoni]